MKRIALCAALLFAIVLAQPAQAVTLPTLSVWSQAQGSSDLRPGGRVLVVAELRATDHQTTTLHLATPAGLVVRSIRPTSGAYIAPGMAPGSTYTPFVLWTGEVSATQPINLAVVYSVLSSTAPGDRQLLITGQAAGVPIATSLAIRVCCVEQPPPAGVSPEVHRLYLATIRGSRVTTAAPQLLPAFYR